MSRAKRWGGDDLHRQRGKGNLRGRRDALESLAHDGQGVFGGEEQHFAGALDGELAQAGRAGGDADGDIQGQETFAAFGFPAQDADGLLGPETFNEPLGLRPGGRELAGALNREGVHDFLGFGSRVNSSK